MKEIKFKVWNNEKKEFVTSHKRKTELDYNTRWLVRPYFMELLQYTGLKDSTKWCQLTGEEKKEFYNMNCSENGTTIKYQHIDDVEPLWKGREIYEGDTLKWTPLSNIGKEIDGQVSFSNGTYWAGGKELGEVVKYHQPKIIGNIYEKEVK